jgi:hypothetical protein
MLSEIIEHKADLVDLAQQFQVKRLEVFGSAASGEFRPGDSDLDFLVEFSSAEPDGFADRYFGLLEGLERLFNQPVDLVVASSVKNPYFREAVERSKVVLVGG